MKYFEIKQLHKSEECHRLFVRLQRYVFLKESFQMLLTAVNHVGQRMGILRFIADLHPLDFQKQV